MPLKISTGDLMRLRHTAERLRTKADRVAEKAEGVIEQFVRTSELGAAAFAAGIVQGRGGITLWDVPAEILAGAGLHLAGFMGFGGKLSGHLHNFADGAIAGYLTQHGQTVGAKMATGEGKKAGMAGALDEGRVGERLSQEKLENLAK